MLLGLRTVIYAAPDLAKAKAFYTTLLGIAPYFDEPFYAGYNVGGYELGLDPNATPLPGAGGAVAYWGVANMEAALVRVQELDIAVLSAPQDVGGGIIVATIGDPAGNVVGLIENPHFTLP